MDNSEFARVFRDRTKRFALDVIRFCAALPRKQGFWIISGQLIRSATSVASNYRAACRAQSRAAFLAKMSIVEEEADESAFWLEMLDAMRTRENPELTRLMKEADEILRITIASKKTARRAPRS